MRIWLFTAHSSATKLIEVGQYNLVPNEAEIDSVSTRAQARHVSTLR